VKAALGLAVACVALLGARWARVTAAGMPQQRIRAGEMPYAPSPSAAPFVALGYREAAADVLYVRMLAHFNGSDSTGHGVADLAEAITALDPQFKRAYDTGATAMTLARHHVDQRTYLRAIALLEEGIKQFPGDWKLPYLAGQMYTQDLKSEDPAQRRTWDEKGTLLVESAIRKPGAPSAAGAWAAVMRTKLGQHDRAVAGLREMLLVTNDKTARKRLVAALAEIEMRDAQALEAEIYEERVQFERTWRAERPTVPATMYILLGPRLVAGFDMVDLATGGRDVLGSAEGVVLEPVE
jgi:hypothetical protein